MSMTLVGFERWVKAGWEGYFYLFFLFFLDDCFFCPNFVHFVQKIIYFFQNFGKIQYHVHVLIYHTENVVVPVVYTQWVPVGSEMWDSSLNSTHLRGITMPLMPLMTLMTPQVIQTPPPVTLPTIEPELVRHGLYEWIGTICDGWLRLGGWKRGRLRLVTMSQRGRYRRERWYMASGRGDCEWIEDGTTWEKFWSFFWSVFLFWLVCGTFLVFFERKVVVVVVVVAAAAFRVVFFELFVFLC